MEKYRKAVIDNKLEDIANTHEAIIEKIASLKMDLNEDDDKVEEALRKVYELVGESLKVVQHARKK